MSFGGDFFHLMDLIGDENFNVGAGGNSFPYLLPSLCNTVFAIGVLFISFQLPVCGKLSISSTNAAYMIIMSN
jgi:hypothetical protein